MLLPINENVIAGEGAQPLFIIENILLDPRSNKKDWHKP